MLFDLTRDVGEERDLAGQHRDMVTELQAAVGEWERDVDAHQVRAR